VNWYVNKHPIKISKKQLDEFTKLWTTADYNKDGQNKPFPLDYGRYKSLAATRLASNPKNQGNNRPTIDMMFNGLNVLVDNPRAIHTGTYTYGHRAKDDDDRKTRNIIILCCMFVCTVIICIGHQVRV